MRRLQLLMLLLLVTAPVPAERATANLQCVKTQCEPKGQACVEALYATYNACTKAARTACDKVLPAEKFKCLTEGLRPCALTRNREQDVCLDSVRSCSQACRPFERNRIYYWCAADMRNGATGIFCPADHDSKPNLEQCAKSFSRASELTGGMACEPLN